MEKRKISVAFYGVNVADSHFSWPVVLVSLTRRSVGSWDMVTWNFCRGHLPSTTLTMDQFRDHAIKYLNSL